MYQNIAHHNMVEQQIRPWEVLDSKVLEAFAAIPRENFVPEAQEALAYADIQLPLGYGEKMLEPKVEARMLQSLELKSNDYVLEIGTGSGFTTALIASIAKFVHSVEINPDLAKFSKTNLENAKINNVLLETADSLSDDFVIENDYDVIVLTGSIREIPDKFSTALKIGGRLFVMLEVGSIALAMIIRRISKNEWLRQELFETTPIPLQQAPAKKVFIF